MKLSVFIITKNEEKNLSECLESVAFADEIVVIDSGSWDPTVAIAKKYTPHVFFRVFDNFGEQKNYAISKTTGDWILSVDADERITPELRLEIQQVSSRESVPFL